VQLLNLFVLLKRNETLQVTRILAVKNLSAYYYEDVAALQVNPCPEDERWFMPGVTAGFKNMREPAEVVSIGVEVNSRIYWGDAVGVSYAGKAGRRGVYRAEAGIREIDEVIGPWLLQQNFGNFRSACRLLFEFSQSCKQALHVATLYGVSQALLSAYAADRSLYEVIAEEWSLTTKGLTPLPIQGSCGNNFYHGTDKMLVQQLAALPHSQVDNISEQVGLDGGRFLERILWLKKRLQKFNLVNYKPVIHLDVHGAFGKIFNLDTEKIATYLYDIEQQLTPYSLRIESPLLGTSRDDHLRLMVSLNAKLAALGSKTVLVIDEWANTLPDIKFFSDSGFKGMVHIKMPDLGLVSDVVDAVLYCKKNGIETLLGGSCIETEISTKIGIHIAMVTRPDFVLARPGMGIDEAIMLVNNEMNRIASVSL
jgi:methylaspartate ammonia-lyase